MAPKLQRLQAAHNLFTSLPDEYYSESGPLPADLALFDIGGNLIGGVFPQALAHHSRLQVLQAAGNRFRQVAVLLTSGAATCAANLVLLSPLWCCCSTSDVTKLFSLCSGPLLEDSWAQQAAFQSLLLLNVSDNMLSDSIPETLQSAGMFQLVHTY